MGIRLQRRHLDLAEQSRDKEIYMKRKVIRPVRRSSALLSLLTATFFLITMQILSEALPAEPAERSLPSIHSATPGFSSIARGVTPAVVNIVSRTARPSDRRTLLPPEFFGLPFPYPFGQEEPEGPLGSPFRGEGMGSGVIISTDGYVVTNNHVVEGATEIVITLPDKREFKARLIGTDPPTDLAVLKIEAHGLSHLTWGDSSRLEVGEYVLAIGNPFGLNSTVTLGIVSALGRGHMGITQYEDFIQTDAAINPGNSGGALIDTSGALVGINTAILSQSGGYQGVGFAVPSTMAKPVVENLISIGKVVRGYFGVGIQDLTPDLVRAFGLKHGKGALVSNITDDSPAAQAGLKQGDVVIEYQGTMIEDGGALQRAVTRTAPGTKVSVKVIRDDHEKDVTVTIGEQPPISQMARAERATENALVGVEIRNLDLRAMRELGLKAKTVGVVVTGVELDSAADRAGVVPGDVIQEINKQPVRTVKDYERVVTHLKKGEPVVLLINRHGAGLFLSVKP